MKGEGDQIGQLKGKGNLMKAFRIISSLPTEISVIGPHSLCVRN